jgi:TonB family protein
LHGEKVNKHRPYSIDDIRRYWSGALSHAEQHAMERAALDDPMLADAMDAFEHQAANSADLDDLRQRISGEAAAPVLPMAAKPGGFAWMRWAAAVVVLLGLGGLIYRFSQPETEDNQVIAKVDSIQNKIVIDTIKSIGNQSVVISDSSKIGYDTEGSIGNGKYDFSTVKQAAEETDKQLATNQPGKKGTTIITTPIDNSAGLYRQNTLDTTTNADAGLYTNIATEKPSTVKSPAVASRLDDERAYKKTDGYIMLKDSIDLAKKEVGRAKSKSNGTLNDEVANRKQKQQQYFFRGLVTDEQGQPLPFAKIKINNEMSTYANVKGQFALYSTDTVMNIEVKGAGFQNNLAMLDFKLQNKVVLKETPLQNQQVEVVGNRGEANYARNRRSAMRSQVDEDEVQPMDGWNNYDTYVANNLDDVEWNERERNSHGIVEVEFQVTAQGTITNAKISQSLNSKADAEALRLVTEGPKWKGKEGQRAKVKIKF